MKRTGKKLRFKGIGNYKPSDALAYSGYSYDRNYIKSTMKDVNFIPFSKGSNRAGDFNFGYEHPNCRLWTYLDAFFYKHIGLDINKVFHEFRQLGWKTSKEMYFYWDSYICNITDSRLYWGNCYYVTENNHLEYKD